MEVWPPPVWPPPVWPEMMVTDVKGVVDDFLKKKTLQQVLEKACYHAMFDPWEQWLCTIDEVMSRLKPFPAQKWPLILHLVMLLEDFDTQDEQLLVDVVNNIKEGEMNLRPDCRKQLDHLCDLMRLRATLLAAKQGKIETVEELSECIEQSVNAKSEMEADMIEKIDELKFNIEEAAILAVKALRRFAGKVHRIAFRNPLSQADEIPMPETKHILEAAKQAEAEFPEKWLSLAVKKLAEDLPKAEGESEDSSPAEVANGGSRGDAATSREPVIKKRKLADARDPRPVVRLRGKTKQKGLKLPD